MAKHTCHHPTCETPVPPRMFACRGHWFSLPRDIRNRILDEYVPGQEITKTPTDDYLDAAFAALDYWKMKAAP